MTRNYIVMWLVLLPLLSMSQSGYIGLRREANIFEGQLNAFAQSYWPRFQVIDNHVYVPTVNGVYSKDLNTLSDTLWSLYAFSGVQIRDFILSGNFLLGITNYTDDSLFVYSEDHGSSFSFSMDSSFVFAQGANTIHQLAQNSPNFGDVLVSHHYGISRSLDTGKTWSILSNFSPEYQYRYVGFHPRIAQRLFSTGEGGFFSSYVYASTDNGVNWHTMFSATNDCVHTIAFHPIDNDTYLIGHEGKISRSLDAGISWSTFNIDPYLYIYQIEFDKDFSNIVYASGGLNGPNDTVYFLRSVDTGSTWSIIHKEHLGKSNVGAVLDFHVHDDGIIYYTAFEGFYYLQLSALGELENPQHDVVEIEVFPNPSEDWLNIQSSKEISRASIFDTKGELILSTGIQDRHETRLNISSLAAGVYVVTVFWNSEVRHIRFIKA